MKVQCYSVFRTRSVQISEQRIIRRGNSLSTTLNEVRYSNGIFTTKTLTFHRSPAPYRYAVTILSSRTLRIIRKSRPTVREIVLSRIKCIVVDEVDRLVDVLPKHAPPREVEKRQKHARPIAALLQRVLQTKPDVQVSLSMQQLVVSA